MLYGTCVQYTNMPTESGSKENIEKYAKILEVLDLDLETLDTLNAPSILYGDFNAHMGIHVNKHWVKDNNEKVEKMDICYIIT